MIIETRAVPPMVKNGYVVGCEETREGVIIDPGDEVGLLLDCVDRHRLTVRYILLTHAHVDHISGVDEAKQAVGAPVVLHRGDLFLYEHAVQQAIAFGLIAREQPAVDRFYDGPGPWRFGRYEVYVHETPGHSPGGVCLQVGREGAPGQTLFVGDTLFAGSVGRVDLPGGDFATLMRSIRHVLLPLGDEARVYPGHGPATTIGDERRQNPFLADAPPAR